MRRIWPALAVVCGLILSPLALPASFAQTVAATSATGRVIVKFKAQASSSRAQALSVPRSAERAASLSQRTGLALTAGTSLDENTHVLFAKGIDSKTLAARLAAQGDVEYAVPDERRHILAVPNDPRYTSVTVSGNSGGPAVGQWYLRAPNSTVLSAINAEAAWDVTTGSTSVVVAVIDTGVFYDHEDLKKLANGGNLLPGYDMISDTSVANDGDGRDADATDPGDWVTGAENSNTNGNFFGCADSGIGQAVGEDSSWHGTQTASLISALTNNGIGMASVGRTLRVLPVRVLGKCGGFDSDIIAGMQWAAGIAVPGAPSNPNPAKVINMSLGGDGSCSAAYQSAVNQINALGVVIVASAGNSAGHAIATPANCNGVIAVAGLRHTGTKVGFSDIGPEVAIAAPGGNCVNTQGTCLYPIITALNTGTTSPVAGGSAYSDGFNTSLGTSFSAPMVTGTVGLILSAQPAMTPADIRTVLQGTARAFPSTGAGAGVSSCQAPTSTDQNECYCTTSTCGAGMLDSGAAVAAAQRGSQARVTASSETPVSGTLLTLSAANSYLISGRTAASYQWTLTDSSGIATTFASSGPTATVTPSAAGHFIVSMTLTDSAGNMSTTQHGFDVASTSSSGGGTGTGSTPPVTQRPTQESGGGALGGLWLALLGAAVVALQLQQRRRQRID